MNFKKITRVTSAFLVAIGLSGCSTTTEVGNEDTIDIVATSFAQYDWSRQIIGDLDNYNLTLLQDDGVDLHNYQPTTEDIAAISSSDVFIYVGGESDEWVDDALSEATNQDQISINLLEVLGDAAKEEELVEGMEADDHDHSSEEEHSEEDHDHEEETAFDEHVWLSLKNAELFVNEITNELSSIDSENTDILQTNADNYIAKLQSLDNEYESSLKNRTENTLVFGDRFPFRYLVDDYGIDYYAAFVGCSAETEASFETIVFLAEKLDELDLKYIMTTESSVGDIATTIVDNSTNKNQDVLQLDSMQSITNEQINEGSTYLSIMESNLDVLVKALN